MPHYANESDHSMSWYANESDRGYHSMRVIEDTTVCPAMLMRIPQYMYVLVC